MKTSPLFDRYFSEDFQGRSVSTVRSHRRYLSKFQSITKGQMTVEAYAEWVRHAFATWGERTARLVAMGASARYCAWLERVGEIDKSPHRRVRLPRPETHETREPFTHEEYRAIRQAARGALLEWPIILAWETGMAISDCSLLQWSSVRLDKAMLRLRRQKTKELCTIPLATDGEVLPLLHEFSIEEPQEEWPNVLPDVSYVMPCLAAAYIRQNKMGSSELQKAFAKIRDRAGVDATKTFHNFRATFCSVLANGGMNLAAACKVTGHRDPKIFERYVTGDAEQLRDQVLNARMRVKEFAPHCFPPSVSVSRPFDRE